MSSFPKAIKELKKGKCYRRKGWNGKGMYVLLIKGDSVRKAINLTYGTGIEEDEGLEVKDSLYLKTADNKLIPWVVSQDDVLATDWELYTPNIQNTPNNQHEFKTDKILKALELHEGTLKDFLSNDSLKRVDYGRGGGHSTALKEFIQSRPEETFLVLTARANFTGNGFDEMDNVFGSRSSIGRSVDWIIFDGKPKESTVEEIKRQYPLSCYVVDKTKIIQLGS